MKNQFNPFRAIRFSETVPNVSSVLAPPYDVISPDEQRRLHESHPNNIVHLDYGFERDTDTVHDNRYTRAKDFLTQWLSQGILKRDPNPAYYLYEHVYRADGHVKQLRGILGAAKLYRFDEKVVLPHENTMPGPIQDRLDLTKACEVNLSPIYTLFDDPAGDFFSITHPVFSSPANSELITQNGDVYRLWVLTDAHRVASIYALFESKKLLIADGHHRYTTAVHYRDFCREKGATSHSESESTMVFATPIQNDGLTIYPTHRVVYGLAGFSADRLHREVAKYFNVSSVSTISELNDSAQGVHDKVIGVIIPGTPGITRLTLKSDADVSNFFPADASDVLKSLDVSILQYIILQGILGFTLDDIRAQKGIKYLKSEQAVHDAVESEEIQAAFVLQATRLDEMRDVCLNGEKMPQKSTYFYPKLITGLVLNPVSPS